jgi:hypothetical protein
MRRISSPEAGPAREPMAPLQDDRLDAFLITKLFSLDELEIQTALLGEPIGTGQSLSGNGSARAFGIKQNLKYAQPRS